MTQSKKLETSSSKTFYIIKSENEVGEKRYVRNTYPRQNDYTHALKLRKAYRFESHKQAELFIEMFKGSRWELKNPEILEVTDTLTVNE